VDCPRTPPRRIRRRRGLAPPAAPPSPAPRHRHPAREASRRTTSRPGRADRAASCRSARRRPHSRPRVREAGRCLHQQMGSRPRDSRQYEGPAFKLQEEPAQPLRRVLRRRRKPAGPLSAGRRRLLLCPADHDLDRRARCVRTRRGHDPQAARPRRRHRIHQHRIAPRGMGQPGATGFARRPCPPRSRASRHRAAAILYRPSAARAQGKPDCASCTREKLARTPRHPHRGSRQRNK
jgi:hypothetical protein